MGLLDSLAVQLNYNVTDGGAMGGFDKGEQKQNRNIETSINRFSV